MADNVKVNPSSSYSAIDVATDEIGNVHYPVYKLSYGADGSQTPVDATNPLPTTSIVTTSNFGVFPIDAPAGNIAGVSTINKFGQNPTMATSATETVWDGSTLYSFPTSATITHLRQATDEVATDANATIEIQGLDTNYALTVQTKDLNGADTTTEVELDTPLRRVFRMKVLENISIAAPVWVGATGMAAGTAKGVIQTGNNQTLMAIYTVPAGKTAYITNYYASLNKDSGGGDPDVVVKMWNQDNTNGYAPQIKHLLGLDSDATSKFTHYFDPYYKVTEKTDIYLTCTNLSGSATADVSGGFDLYLVD